MFPRGGNAFPPGRVCVSPSPFQRGLPATPRTPASRPEFCPRSLTLAVTCGAAAAFRSVGCSLRPETASAPRSRPPLARRRPGATLREVTPCPRARSRHRWPCRAHAFADSGLRSHPPLSTSRPRLGGGRHPPPGDDAGLTAGMLPALACARFSFRLERCAPFARVFAAVGDGFGSALTAASRDASPKRDPSRGHALSWGQVATPVALPRSRLRRLLPPLPPSSLHFEPAPRRRALPPAGR